MAAMPSIRHHRREDKKLIARTKRLYWRSMMAAESIARRLDDRLKPLYCPLQQRNNCGIFAVDIKARVGFFAQLNWCLYVFAHCERYNLKPAVVLSSPFYARHEGDNWLDYYFDPPFLSEEDRGLLANGRVKVSHISRIGQLGLPKNYGQKMTLENANRLFYKNLSIKDDIQDYVRSFVSAHFEKRRVVGLHYRGTDKIMEAQAVSYDHVRRVLVTYLDANPQVNAVFVASDEEGFILKIRKEFKRVEVICHDDLHRSRDGAAIHTRPDGDPSVKGREALVNCLLLSKCDTLIRTSSFLSGWSSVLNPALPVIMLNRPFDKKLWFPDAVIIKSALQIYSPDRALS